MIVSTIIILVKAEKLLFVIGLSVIHIFIKGSPL
jgi:hypothetical protein